MPIDVQPRAMPANLALAKASKLSGRQAHEVWYVMQRITSNQSREGLSGPLIQSAMDFIHYPKAWKVIVTKAAIYQRLSRKPNR